MKVCTCFLLFTIFALSNSISQNKQPENPRSVNLALETVLEFNNKAADIKFLDDVHEFISKVKTVIGNNRNSRRDFPAPRPATFTGFIHELINVISTYDDTAFEDFFSYLDDEIRKYHYRGCKFYELTENYEMRKLLAAKLNMIKGKPVIIMRAYINLLADMIRDEEYDDNVKEFVDYINSLYREDAEQKFQKILSELEYYGKSKSKRNNNHLVKIIRDGVRSVLFDYYSNLNPNARRELKSNIDVFWRKQFKEPRPPSASTRPNDIPYTGAVVDRFKNSNNIIVEHKNPVVFTIKQLTVTTPKKEENTTEATKSYKDVKVNRIEIKKSDYKNTGIIVDRENDEKKGYKNTRFDAINKKYQGKGTTAQTPKQDEQRAIIGNQNQSKDFSSDEVISDNSFESNSIEFSQELQREYNTKPYMTLYPEEINKPTTTTKKVSKKHVHRSHKLTTAKTKGVTMSAERSTGKLPKALAGKLTTKKKHHSKHKKSHKSKHGSKHSDKNENKHRTRHGKEHKLTHNKEHRMKHDKKHSSKHEVKQKQWHKTKQKHEKHSKTDWSMPEHGKAKVFKQNKVLSTNMELYEYKKMFGPVRVDIIPNTSATTINTRASTPLKSTTTTKPALLKRIYAPTRQFPPVPPRLRAKITTMKPTQRTTPSPPAATTSRWLITAINNEYPKPSKQTAGKTNGELRKSAEFRIRSNEGMSIERSETDRKIRRNTKSSITTPGPEKVQYVIKRINDLEKELKDVKNQISDIKIGGFNVKRDTNRFGAKDFTEKGKPSEYQFGTYLGITPLSFKIRKDNFKLTGTAEKKYEDKYAKQNNYSSMTDKTATNNKTLNVLKQPERTEDNKSKVITHTNFLYSITSKTKVTKGVKLMIEDQDYVNAKDPRIVMDYHGVDEWHEALKFARIKAKSSSARTTKSTTVTTPTSKSTAKPSTAVTTAATLAAVPVSSSSKSTDAVKKAPVTTTVHPNTNISKTTSYLTSDVSETSTLTTKVLKEIQISNMTSDVNIVTVTNSTKLESVVTSSISTDSKRSYVVY